MNDMHNGRVGKLMPTRLKLLAVVCLSCSPALAQPMFTGVEPLANGEIALTLSAATGRSHHLRASTNAQNWSGLLTFPTNLTTSLQHSDSAAPYLPARFYRATTLAGSNILSGDHLPTTNGDVVIHPVNHAGFVMKWNETWIYNDPVAGSFGGFPKADLILVSHTHGDHFSATTLGAVSKAASVIIAPQAVYNSMSAALQSLTTVLDNGESTNVLAMNIEAVPAYNGNHPLGSGNGYVLMLGGRRIYMSGDTGNQPEIRALPDIDVAFLCMNIPFTMTVTDATNCVWAMKPKVVYPYHYRDQGGYTGNAATFKQWLGTEPGIEVRLRNWY